MHLMIDLETLSLAPNAVVAELGFCEFDIHTQDFILRQDSWHLNLEAQVRNGRDFSVSTFNWWLKQNQAAQHFFADAARKEVHEVLEEFIARFEWENIEGVWSHGANFDIPILEGLLREYGFKTPWHYRNTRDTRTILWLAGIEHKGTAHNAIDDCIAQAKAVQRAFKIIQFADNQLTNGSL